ncbi:hypothetical protein ACFOY4_07310 [Actinomadura syzygii]|uniref:TPM domain-containing protein n=1 Tax=Actinomadura syzygii TaxID=1427538 RepID=A0A5D0UGY8_9ACTN|nr:hypothetical protein [Actinomadura syzygii]TYC16853.1 hypothetical protein FXF65_09970 [Actinomadura syzygii]
MKRAVHALIAALVAFLVAWPPTPAAADIPPYAYHRLDRVAAALAHDPLFVDPDLAAALDEHERAEVRTALRGTSTRLGTPVYVVVIPNPIDSESQGRDDAFLFALHDRSHRDGLYLMAGAYGHLESEAFGVPRDYDPFDAENLGGSRPADRDRPFDGLAERLAKRLDGYAAAPSASPTMPRLYSSPDPFGQEDTLRPREADRAAPFITGLILVGPITAGTLYCAVLGVLALVRRRRRAAERLWAPTEPGMRDLRRHAAAELARLRDRLTEAETDQGRAYAVSAFDAAQILYDDAEDDEERAVDLVGVIVLARQGRAALAGRFTTPPPPCLVNPLHGDSVVLRKAKALDVDRVLPARCPLCGPCRDLHQQNRLRERHLLRVPGPDGPRRHTAVPGVWRDTAWGARDRNVLPRVMRYLGVD